MTAHQGTRGCPRVWVELPFSDPTAEIKTRTRQVAASVRLATMLSDCPADDEARALLADLVEHLDAEVDDIGRLLALRN